MKSHTIFANPNQSNNNEIINEETNNINKNTIKSLKDKINNIDLNINKITKIR